MAVVWYEPAATDSQLVEVPTWTGTLLSVFVPIPSWPYVFHPQAQSVPLVLTATAWAAPADMDGVVEPVVFVFDPFPPHALKARTSDNVRSPKSDSLPNLTCIMYQPV
jgi:hypothetical protein